MLSSDFVQKARLLNLHSELCSDQTTGIVCFKDSFWKPAKVYNLLCCKPLLLDALRRKDMIVSPSHPWRIKCLWSQKRNGDLMGKSWEWEMSKNACFQMKQRLYMLCSCEWENKCVWILKFWSSNADGNETECWCLDTMDCIVKNYFRPLPDVIFFCQFSRLCQFINAAFGDSSSNAVKAVVEL